MKVDKTVCDFCGKELIDEHANDYPNVVCIGISYPTCAEHDALDIKFDACKECAKDIEGKLIEASKNEVNNG
jgi:hypothetical protein